MKRKSVCFFTCKVGCRFHSLSPGAGNSSYLNRSDWFFRYRSESRVVLPCRAGNSSGPPPLSIWALDAPQSFKSVCFLQPLKCRFYENFHSSRGEAVRPLNRLRMRKRIEESCGWCFPQLNVSEDDSRYYIRAELPGVTPGELDVPATAKTVSIAGERKQGGENKDVRYHRREREAGRFSRVLGMPGEIDPEKIEAGMENGVLTIRVPKADAVKPRKITIH